MTSAIGQLPTSVPSASQQAAASQSEATSLATNGTGGLGKQDFLQLLIAQLRNQDPLKPMEDKEFIAQLAQFSSLEALQGLSTKIDGLAKTSGLEQATALIGKTIEASLADGSTLQGVVSQVRVVGGVPQLVVNNQMVGVDKVTLVFS